MEITRHRWGKGFTYRDSEGVKIGNSALKKWIMGLAIPPAWKEVTIDTNRNSKVLAWGRDIGGKKQYIYSDSWSKAQEKEKFDRLIRFAKQLERMRRITGQHLNLDGQPREKVLACMVRLIDTAYFRPGNERYTQQNDTYGLTTLRSRHLTIDGDEIEFKYVGKSGVQQCKSIEDKRLSKVIAELDEVPGYRIFKYFDEEGNKVYVSSEDLNLYIREIMGEDFSAKDFRTWAGTSLMALALDELDIDESKALRDSAVTEAIKSVAQRLGNTPDIAKSSYIDPRVIDHYLDGRTLSFFKKQVRQALEGSLVSIEERAVLKLLQHRLRAP